MCRRPHKSRIPDPSLEIALTNRGWIGIDCLKKSVDVERMDKRAFRR
jgi:hypothetical protein